MISTSRGWVESLNFFAERDLRALRLTLWFCSCAAMSSRAISAHAFARDSFYILAFLAQWGRCLGYGHDVTLGNQ